MERILAIDYGRRRVGMAASDPLGIIAQPIGTHEGTPADALEAIATVCEEREISLIVLGLPLNMDGTEGDMAKEVRGFGAKISERTGLRIEYIDERLSSWNAEQQLKGVKRKKGDRGRIDAMAASQILRDYLDSARE